jgi:hypothetical protein
VLLTGARSFKKLLDRFGLIARRLVVGFETKIHEAASGYPPTTPRTGRWREPNLLLSLSFERAVDAKQVHNGAHAFLVEITVLCEAPYGLTLEKVGLPRAQHLQELRARDAKLAIARRSSRECHAACGTMIRLVMPAAGTTSDRGRLTRFARVQHMNAGAFFIVFCN